MNYPFQCMKKSRSVGECSVAVEQLLVALSAALLAGGVVLLEEVAEEAEDVEALLNGLLQLELGLVGTERLTDVLALAPDLDLAKGVLAGQEGDGVGKLLKEDGALLEIGIGKADDGEAVAQGEGAVPRADDRLAAVGIDNDVADGNASLHVDHHGLTLGAEAEGQAYEKQQDAHSEVHRYKISDSPMNAQIFFDSLARFNPAQAWLKKFSPSGLVP